MRRPSEVAIALALTLAALAAGSALYSQRQPAASGRATQPEWVAMQTEPVGDPVRVVNPFDASETFEFPAGTSEADAREAVAGFLIERATRRGVAGGHKHPGSRG
jgi:hypothetical protein